MAAPHPNDSSGPPSSKRQRTAAMYNRKRAVTACEPCRRRKTRCDNVRPICGFCNANQGRCTYPDNAASNDHATYDPASLAILDRINHVVSLLEARPLPDQASQSPSVDIPSSQPPTSHAHSYVAPARRWEDDDIQGIRLAGIPVMMDDDLFGRTDAPNYPATLINCESILKWPVFSASGFTIRSFVLDHAATGDRTVNLTSAATTGLHRGIQEEDFNNLSRRFLSHVNIKNPVLDIIEYKRFVKEAVEQGLRWDGSSCLVLITCALGCLSEPFDPTHGSYSGSPLESLSSQNYNTTSSTTMSTAKCYYEAAQKRIGLISPSHLCVQCLFLFGVFEMYCLHPLQAWNYFSQACLQLRNILWWKSRGQLIRTYDDSLSDNPVPKTTHLLEQRLYWSCFKSELELRCEIPLPQSGLAHLKHPDNFPCPPTRFGSPTSNMGELATALVDDKNLEEQRSWFYYLAEISHRRMMNRAIMVMTSRDMELNDGWIHDIVPNLQRLNHMNDQIDVWCSHVPPLINREVSDHELAHFVQIRSFMCREWIHRPFLYYAIHQPMDDPYIQQALPLAEKCLSIASSSSSNPQSIANTALGTSADLQYQEYFYYLPQLEVGESAFRKAGKKHCNWRGTASMRTKKKLRTCSKLMTS